MTTQEFSLEFDILYNNITSNQAPGLTEYEKSVFLTQAQEEVVISLYEGKYGEAFEATEELRSYLDVLVKTTKYNEFSPAKDVTVTLPSDYWYIIYESAKIEDNSFVNCDNNTKEVYVYPVTHDTLYKTKESPFRGANSRRILRLNDGDNTVTLISKYPIIEYVVKYLRKPNPIILVNLDNNLTIDNSSNTSTCELSEALHRPILRKAVDLAKQVWLK